MNRPIKNDYWQPWDDQSSDVFLFDAYERDLEMYCDALEKALNKACERLRDFDEMEQLNHGLRRAKDKDEWKEWCMEDE